MSDWKINMHGKSYLIDLVQDHRISIANALEILQSCTEPSMLFSYMLITGLNTAKLKKTAANPLLHHFCMQRNSQLWYWDIMQTYYEILFTICLLNILKNWQIFHVYFPLSSSWLSLINHLSWSYHWLHIRKSNCVILRLIHQCHIISPTLYIFSYINPNSCTDFNLGGRSIMA